MAIIVGTSFRDFIHRSGDGYVKASSDNEIGTVTFGDDSIDAGIGNDFVHADAGDDTVIGAMGNDSIIAGAGRDTVSGDEGVDTINGGQGADYLTGGIGNDLFLIETGSDIDRLAETIDGGADFDELNFTTFNAFGPVDLSAATITGIERIRLTGSPDVTLTAAQLGSFQEIIVSSGSFPGRLALAEAGTADLSGAIISGFAGEIRGTAGADGVILTGVVAGVTVNGRDGLDTLTGGNGADILNGGSGNDSLSGDRGNDKLFGERGVDTIAGGLGDDTLVGSKDADVLFGDDGDDVFAIELVNDIHLKAETIDGGDDVDRLDFQSLDAAGTVNITAATLIGIEEIALETNSLTLTTAQLDAFTGVFGGSGFDRITLAAAGTVDLTGDTVVGIEEMRGSAGNDRIDLSETVAGPLLDGRNGNDTLTGGNNADRINGGNQNDGLNGGDGNDTLTGGGGGDTLTGGGGFDVFDFNIVTESARGPGRDTITDFNHGEDVINLLEIDANTEMFGNQAFVFVFGPFTGDPAQLRYSEGSLFGDVDGDMQADFQIVCAGAPEVLASDIIL